MPESIRRPEGQIPMSPSVRVMTGMGPSPEDLNRFRGPGEVIPQITDIQRAQTPGQPEIFQPTSQANLPSIEMMAGKGGRGKEPDEESKKLGAEEQLLQMERRAAMFGEGRGGYMRKLLVSLQGIQEDKRIIDDLTANVKKVIESQKNPSNPDPSKFVPIYHGTDFKKSLEELAVARDELREEAKRANEDPNIDRETREYLNNLLLVVEDRIKKEPAEYEIRLERRRAGIREAYEDVKHTALDELNGLNKFLEHFRNPYPYDSRSTIYSFQMMVDQVDEMLRRPEGLDDEAIAFATMVKRDAMWGLSAATVIESMGPALENFFDGEMVIQKQRGPHTDILAEDFIRFLYKEMDGLEPTEAQRRLLEKTLGKKEGEKLGLRERAIELQDNYGLVLYKLVAIGQKNFELGWDEPEDGKEEGEKYAVVSREEFEFLRALLNTDTIYDPREFLKFDENGRLVPLDDEKSKKLMELRAKVAPSMKYRDADGKEYDTNEAIMNPFCMDKSDEIAIRTLRARVHELVQNYDLYLGMISAAKGNNEEIQRIAQQLIAKADIRVMNWERGDIEGTDFRMTDTVIRSLNNLETGIYATGDMGWGWRNSEVRLIKKPGILYKLDKNGVVMRYKDGEHKGEPIVLEVAKNPYIEINGERIYKGDARYSENFWNFIDKNLIFKENYYGVDGAIFYPEKGPDGKYHKKKINESMFSKTELEAISKLAIRTFVTKPDKADPNGDTNPDLRRIQEKDGRQFIVKRKSELGSIYETSDITTIVFWARHNIDYDTTAYSRSTMFFPSIGWFRDRWVEQPPYWRPTLEEFAARDHKLMRSLGLETGSNGILSDTNAFKDQVGRKWYLLGQKGLQTQTYGVYNKKSAAFIRNNVWAFVTPWSNNPGSGEEGEYDLVMPVFLPTALTDLSLWRQTTLASRAGKVSSDPGRTIWHERLQGKKLSELHWKNMDVNKNSRFVNTGDQLERWLGPLITPHVFNRMTAGEVEKFYNNPGGLAEKEGGKRAGLSLSGNRVEDGVIRSTVFAQNKVLASVYVQGVMGKASEAIAGEKIKRELALESQALKLELDAWRAQTISEWINTYLDLPGTVKGIENYPGTAAMSMVVSYLQARRIVASAIVTGTSQHDEVDESIDKLEDLF